MGSVSHQCVCEPRWREWEMRSRRRRWVSRVQGVVCIASRRRRCGAERIVEDDTGRAVERRGTEGGYVRDGGTGGGEERGYQQGPVPMCRVWRRELERCLYKGSTSVERWWKLGVGGCVADGREETTRERRWDRVAAMTARRLPTAQRGGAIVGGAVTGANSQADSGPVGSPRVAKKQGGVGDDVENKTTRRP